MPLPVVVRVGNPFIRRAGVYELCVTQSLDSGFCSLGALACNACWVLSIFGVFLGYEVVYVFHHRWRFRESARLRLE